MEGSCTVDALNTCYKNDGLDADGASTTVTTADFYFYGVEAQGGRFDFDAKLMKRENVDEVTTAKDGEGIYL